MNFRHSYLPDSGNKPLLGLAPGSRSAYNSDKFLHFIAHRHGVIAVAANNRPGDLPEYKSLKIRPVMVITGFFLPGADLRLYSIGLLLVIGAKTSRSSSRGYGVFKSAPIWGVVPAAQLFTRATETLFIK